MKIRKVDEIKKCDLCGETHKDTYYDAPTRGGQWANMCPDCWKKEGAPSLGTCFRLRDRSNQPEKKDGILPGIEANGIEEIVLDGDREIECPNCGELRFVEPDADYVFECDGCGSKVQVPNMLGGL